MIVIIIVSCPGGALQYYHCMTMVLNSFLQSDSIVFYGCCFIVQGMPNKDTLTLSYCTVTNCSNTYTKADRHYGQEAQWHEG